MHACLCTGPSESEHIFVRAGYYIRTPQDRRSGTSTAARCRRRRWDACHVRDSYILQLRPLWVQLARILPNLPTGKKRSTSLVSQVSESKISFKDAQLDAHAVVKDGCSVPCTSKLARLGGWGQHPGNCARDFRNAVLKKSVQMLPMYVVELPFLSAEDNAVQWSEQAVVLPHEYLHYLSLREKDFERRLFGESSGREYCREYWQKAPASAWFGSHPARAKICADPCTVAPARLYGDDASYQKQRSALVLTWSSVLCRLPSMLSRFVITVLPLRNAVPETTQALYKIVAWSFISNGGHLACIHFSQDFLPDASMFCNRTLLSAFQIEIPFR